MSDVKKVVSKCEMTPAELAIYIGTAFGGIDGAHHKTWVIDQMQRALMECPVEWYTYVREDGEELSDGHEFTGTSEAYDQYCNEYLDHYLGEGWEEEYDQEEIDQYLEEGISGTPP